MLVLCSEVTGADNTYSTLSLTSVCTSGDSRSNSVASLFLFVTAVHVCGVELLVVDARVQFSIVCDVVVLVGVDVIDCCLSAFTCCVSGIRGKLFGAVGGASRQSL